MLPLRQLIQNLVSIAVRDGNYLLNIGPDGTGKMDEEQVERLRQAGEWLSKYGETLYGLRGGPVIADRWGGTTYRDNIVYVHILEWEKDQITFEIPGNTMEKWEVISGGKAELTEENGGWDGYVWGDTREEYIEVRRAFLTMDEEDRMIVGMHVFGGYKTREIAQILAMNENTVRSREHRALQRMEKQLKGLR